jgi:hypothetical protein
MSMLRAPAVVIACLFLTSISAAAGNAHAENARVARVSVAGPMVIGFFPPVFDEAPDSGAEEGLAHLEFALSDVAKCLESRSVLVRAEIAQVLVLQIAGKEQRISLPRDWPRSVGAYLVMPGREPRPVFATVGPSSMQQLLPDAVAEYFDMPACKFKL